jgi:ribonuclease BN (tRNA processing enzyme)
VDICFLGTAPGLPLPDRFGQTIVVTTNGGESGAPAHYVLDTGDGASSLLIRNGFDHLAIQGIVITHMHADHHAGLVQVLKTSMHLRRQDELVILAPEEGIPALRAYLDASYLYPDWLGYPIRWESLADLAAGDGIALLGSLVMRAFHNDHLDTARRRFAALGIDDHRRTFESYSLTLEHDGVRVVYSGNLLGAAGAHEMAAYAEPADLLICELAHVEPDELGRFLAHRRIGQTVLAHISPKWQGVPDAEIVALVHAATPENAIPGTVTIARDGDRCLAVTSGRNEPTARRR